MAATLIASMPGLIKINDSNRSYRIGSGGNDAFEANYCDRYKGICCDINRLVNFVAGGGDDVIGKPSRNDALWLMAA